MKKIISATMLVSFIAFSCGMLPKSVEKNGVKIQYSGDVTKEEATKLVDYLDANGFSDGRQKDLKLSKSGDAYNLKMVVREGFDLDEKNIELMNDFACEVSKGAFDGKTVNLDLCNNTWGVLKSLKSENCDQFEMLDKEKKNFGKVEIFYGKDVTTKELNDVGKYMTDTFGDDVERTFAIDKKEGRGILSIVVTNKKYYEDPELKDIYRIIACDMGKILGYETDVHMCDEYMKMQEVVKASKCD